MEFTANEKKEVAIQTSTGQYDRCAVRTHFIQVGEDYNALVERYVKPMWREGDMLAISEKIVSLCQRNVIYRKDMKISFLARFLSRFATQHSAAGIGVGDVYKMQYAIDRRGALRILWAAVCAGVCKLFGKKGVFYKMAGDEVRGLDGFYPDVFPVYGEFGIPLPRDPDGVCAEIREKTGVETMIIDANDFTCDILGKSGGILLTEEQLCEILRDNPAGQDDQCTPFILIRKR